MPGTIMYRWRFVITSLALTLTLTLQGCSGGQRPKPPPTLDERAAAAVERWAAGLATTPEKHVGEDVLGELSLAYRALSTVSPRAGVAVGATLADHLVSMVPGFLCHWIDHPCGKRYAPHVLLPAGAVGQAFIDAGVVEGTVDGRFVALPGRATLGAFEKLASKRRASLIAKGAATCRMRDKLHEWRPEPMHRQGCTEVWAKGDDQVLMEARALCLANVLLWDYWQGVVASVWNVRLECGGTPGLALITLKREAQGDDGVMFVVLGNDVPSIVEQLGPRP